MKDSDKSYGFWARLWQELPNVLTAIRHPIATWRAFREGDTE